MGVPEFNTVCAHSLKPGRGSPFKEMRGTEEKKSVYTENGNVEELEILMTTGDEKGGR